MYAAARTVVYDAVSFLWRRGKTRRGKNIRKKMERLQEIAGSAIIRKEISWNKHV
jgi:hypothetical protein